MTTIYKPVLIETAEQAEALPIGTVAIHHSGPTAAVRVDYGAGWHIAGDEMSEDPAHIVGWTALVPIEAEEETVDASTWATPGRIITRLTTRWEEA